MFAVVEMVRVLVPSAFSVGWENVAGRTYTLTLTSHDDNNRADPTLTLFDDVAITGTVSPVRTN